MGYRDKIKRITANKIAKKLKLSKKKSKTKVITNNKFIGKTETETDKTKK